MRVDSGGLLCLHQGAGDMGIFNLCNTSISVLYVNKICLRKTKIKKKPKITEEEFKNKKSIIFQEPLMLGNDWTISNV